MSNAYQLSSYSLLKGMGLDFTECLLNIFLDHQNYDETKKEIEQQTPPYIKYLEDIFNTSVDAKTEIDHLLLTQNNNATALKQTIEKDYVQFLESYNELMILIENDKSLWVLYNKYGGFRLDYIYKWYLWFEERHLQTKINQEEYKERIKSVPQRLVFLEDLGINDFLRMKYENYFSNQTTLSKYLAHIINEKDTVLVRKYLNKITSRKAKKDKQSSAKGYTLTLLNALGINLKK